MGSAFKALWKSRKFLLLVLNAAIYLVLYFVGKYGGPEVAADTEAVMKTLTPIFIAVIIGIAVEDAAQKLGMGGGPVE